MTSSYFDEMLGEPGLHHPGMPDAVDPPWPFVAVMALEVALAAACLLGGGRPANWVGYVLGTWVLTATAIAYRREARRRSRRPDVVYFDRPWARRAVFGLLASGFLVAVVHVGFIAQTKSFA